MPRKLKPYKVDSVHNADLGVTVHILFDREKQFFFGEINGERVQAATALECKKLAKELIPKAVKLTWEPMIDVDTYVFDERTEQFRDGEVKASLELSFRRFEISRTLTGERRVRAHILDNPNPERHASPGRGADARIPYTPETWQQLQKLADVVKQAGKQLQELIGDPNRLVARLSAGNGLPALPAAKVESAQPKKRKAVGA